MLLTSNVFIHNTVCAKHDAYVEDAVGILNYAAIFNTVSWFVCDLIT